VVQDRTGQWWAIGQGQGSVQAEQVQFYRHRARPTSTPESADVAVLLSCEKEDKYEYWITYLGNDRKDKFAFVGELPKVLQTEQYWAWESGRRGRFEFNPYRGATGGFGGGIATSTNHDGAVIDAGPSGAFYQSEAWNGGGDKGGVVTPRWTKVLSDYEITARTYLQTLCYPLIQYTDVTWEWSDGGGGYALRKVLGGGVTTGSGEQKIRTRWVADWGYRGGGGSVEVDQEEEILVNVQQTRSDSTNTYVLRVPGQKPVYRQQSFTFRRSTRRKGYEPGIAVWVRPCWGLETNLTNNWDFATEYVISLRNEGGTNYWYLNDSKWGAYGGAISWDAIGCYRGFFWSTMTLEIVYLKSGAPFDPNEYNLEVLSGSEGVWGTGWTETPTADPEIDVIPPGDSNVYSIQVFDRNDVEVASDSASSQISHGVRRYETRRVGFFIRQYGENINGRFENGDEVPEEYREVEVEAGGLVPTVTGEVNLITAKIETWVEVGGERLAKIELDGRDGQRIAESPAYEEATKPYTGPNGQTVYPCYPQKTEDNPLKEEKKSFQGGEGFNAYHITFYASYDRNDNLVAWTPFDFNNPALSGTLPPPSVNHLYSLTSTDLLVSYDPVARLSWGADIPEENPETGETTNLEEEQIDGVDKNGVLYPLVKGFTYGLYGPIKASNILLNQRIDKQEGQSLANYDLSAWTARNRARKPRTYVLGPDDFEEGEPFEEFDVSDLNQRGLNQMQMTMGRTFRQSLWGYSLGPIGNEREEDWRHQAATFADVTSGGSTPNQRRFFNDPAFNSSNVRQSGDKRVDIKVNMGDVRALLKATERKDVRFMVYPEGGGDDAEPTEKIFKMNPIQDVFEGYDDVKILAVAGIIY